MFHFPPDGGDNAPENKTKKKKKSSTGNDILEAGAKKRQLHELFAGMVSVQINCYKNNQT